MNELSNHLGDILTLTITLSFATSIWLVRSNEPLKDKLLLSLIDVSKKHSLKLEKLLDRSKNMLILQSYFVDINIITYGRIGGFLSIFFAFIFLGTTLFDGFITGNVVFIIVAVFNVLLVLFTLLLIHRRERVKELDI